MSPRSASVNEELRRRSRERLLQAALELVGERGYDATTLGDIADRAGSARGLVSYYFPGKRLLVQSAVHRLMHRTLDEALEREPRTDDGQERMARAIDAILGLARDHPVVMRQHMAGILQGEGFKQCPEQRRLAELLSDTMSRYGSPDTAADYPMLRALLMGAVYAALVPGVPMPVPVLRAELFRRYGLDWERGAPPGAEAPGGTYHEDLSRFFAPGSREPEEGRGDGGVANQETDAAGQSK
ncbi:TetR/AcrR family transcriptional regulator [Streptomyces sp. NPDC057620]|uniref:TetR/AcrR family transcriptional regulator n=1 Tax=Streptomyces liliiviolaceus TaxID=2823109 RepID=A0A940Y107_9ACTN|nr:TetR/AcrR family transcriptional regulator [Streptomyces liliiviolaceus]MBQ0853711.1 TetR/AcrR family transcriptional regulator [Streptomyces liliiviolaceus]